MRTPPFSIEEVARLPLPGMAIPGLLAFSPDGRWITYLFSEEGSLVRQLYKFDTQTGEASRLTSAPSGTTNEEDLTPEERLRRERSRQRELGITDYAWAPVGERLLIPLPDGLYIQQGAADKLGLLVSSREGVLSDPQFSPDGNWVAYVQNRELFIVPALGGEPRQLTSGAGEASLTHGLAEYIAQEEMHRKHGYWWSPDSALIAFEQVDERHIPLFTIMHLGKDSLEPNAQEEHHYPFAGQANARVKLGVVKISGGEPVWMDLGEDEDIYLARVDWFADGRLAAQMENRAQDELRLLAFDPATGRAETLLVETNPVWIELNDLFRPLREGLFLWGSERSGYQHLYLYAKDGKLIRPLTGGDWTVETVAAVDEANELVYFTGTGAGPLENHLYVICLDGSRLREITPQPGTHNVVVDAAHGRFIDTHDALDQPPLVTLRSLADGGQEQLIYYPQDPRVADEGLRPPEMVHLHSRDGALLYAAFYRPPDEFGSGPYPVVVLVYGGPHAQVVANSWRMTANMRAQYLRSLGFLVFCLDNRGSARRGLEFGGVIKHHLGTVEVQDQEDGVRWLVEKGLADPERVGITGWSYGGYMTLMCLAKAPETFKAGAAGAPVTSWDGYDTHYTEHYLSTPQSNPHGYHDSSVIPHVGNIQGPLLLVHGMIDENVHFRHTVRLINALIRTHKPYELILFPDERHGPRRLEDRVYLEERLRDFFIEAFNQS